MKRQKTLLEGLALESVCARVAPLDGARIVELARSLDWLQQLCALWGLLG